MWGFYSTNEHLNKLFGVSVLKYAIPDMKFILKYTVLDKAKYIARQSQKVNGNDCS